MSLSPVENQACQRRQRIAGRLNTIFPVNDDINAVFAKIENKKGSARPFFIQSE